METVQELLNSAGDWFWNAVGTMGERFFNESSYRAGFVACLVTITVGGVVVRIFIYAWDLVLSFFRATKAPPKPTDGPTPVGLGEGCLEGIIILIVGAVVGLFLLWKLLSQ